MMRILLRAVVIQSGLCGRRLVFLHARDSAHCLARHASIDGHGWADVCVALIFVPLKGV